MKWILTELALVRAVIGVAVLLGFTLCVYVVAYFVTDESSRASRSINAFANILGGAFLGLILAMIAVAVCATIAWVFSGAAI